MKFGAHIFLWSSHWDATQLPLLDRAKALGLDCLEIAVGDDVQLSPSLGKRAAALGLDLVISPGGTWPMECDISLSDAADRAKGIAWHRHWISRAAEVGAVAYTGAIYGHPGNVQNLPLRDDELRRAADGLHALAEHAADCGVVLAIEPMSHFRTHLINTPQQAMQLIELADHPNLRVLIDTYHIVTEVRDYAAAVTSAAGTLWGIHACENDRGVPGGGIVPWSSIFAALREIGFDGCIIMESYNSSIPGFAESHGMFHNVCPDGDRFVREGLRFLRAK
ncbi:MAG TPA: sugar phosphate isomerase/epimerase family protein [Planctomycetota bacterium]|nr:sugar phosphate isomerase/epimerase family protein [Planctomycetota bacterium]